MIESIHKDNAPGLGVLFKKKVAVIFIQSNENEYYSHATPLWVSLEACA